MGTCVLEPPGICYFDRYPPMITIFLDPDGTHNMGSYVLITHPTGVRYETQCNGTATDLRGAEGFLVTVGPRAAFDTVLEYFGSRFARAAGRPGWRSVAEWSDDDRAELARRVAAVQIWTTGPVDRDESRPLRLDETRLDDSYEAWVAVITPYGPGWLLGANSD